MYQNEKHYDRPSWKPAVKKTPDGYYVSRRRKGKDAEYLNEKGEWLLWATYFPDENAANAALKKTEQANGDEE